MADNHGHTIAPLALSRAIIVILTHQLGLPQSFTQTITLTRVMSNAQACQKPSKNVSFTNSRVITMGKQADNDRGQAS